MGNWYEYDFNHNHSGWKPNPELRVVALADAARYTISGTSQAGSTAELHLSGTYLRTAHSANGKLVYQHGGDDGRVLCFDQNSRWVVGGPGLIDSECLGAKSLWLAGSGCESPDDCVGEWSEATHDCGENSTWCANPRIKVVTSIDLGA